MCPRVALRKQYHTYCAVRVIIYYFDNFLYEIKPEPPWFHLAAQKCLFFRAKILQRG